MTIREHPIQLRSHKQLVKTKRTLRHLTAIATTITTMMDTNKKKNTLTSSKYQSFDCNRPIASLKNSGNTCYLNSILYILRFTSRFRHNLHHLIDDAIKLSQGQDTRAKSSSLGRNTVATNNPSNSRSSSTKDLLTVGLEAPQNRVFLVTEKLHEVFATLHSIESAKRAPYDAYLPQAFLDAVRATHAVFARNEQQDAHELLLYLFENIRETCDYVDAQSAIYPSISSASGATNNKLWSRFMSKRAKKGAVLVPYSSSDSECDEDDAKARHFLIEDFRGVAVRRTKCVQCENVTQRKEQFYELAMPIGKLRPGDLARPPRELYLEAFLAPEMLRGTNKYHCGDCRHLEEAVRSVVFERLPNIMILQQKRFMHTTEGCDKVNTFMPTPLRLECFCDECDAGSVHAYKLTGVVMHVGSSMQSGHYKSYVAASEHADDYANCSVQSRRDHLQGGRVANMFLLSTMKARYTNNHDACATRSCCGIKMNANLNASFNAAAQDAWLECNDEKIRAISVDELQEELAYKAENNNTPYLLFYEKVEMRAEDNS